MAYLFNAWPPFRYRPGLGHHPSWMTGISGTVLYLLQWSGYPIAIYSIASSEKRITETTNLREGLNVIETEVENGLEPQSTAYFETATWDYIPWELVTEGRN